MGIVARERRYLAIVDAPSVECSRAFVAGVREANGAHFVAVDPQGEVVGWCDVVRFTLEGFRHSGRLGMGLVPRARSRGIGRRLAEAAIAAAQARGVERIELEVFAQNTPAIRLYERLGFMHEGVKRRARKLDGVYKDMLVMALLVDV